MSNTNILTPNPGTQSSNANSSGFNILIVDDEEYIVDFLREALNFWGYATQVATKVADALEILKSSKINLPRASPETLHDFFSVTTLT